MAQFVPTTTAFDTAVQDRSSARYYRLKVDRNDDGDVGDANEDLTAYIYRNSLEGGGKLEGSSGQAVANKWSVTLVNTDLGLSPGDLANALCTIEAQAGAAGYITIFTGYVSEKGAECTISWTSQDFVTLEMFDAMHKLERIRTEQGVMIASYKVSDPSDTSSSLIHYLADQLGLDAGDLSVGTITDQKDLVTISRGSRPIRELQELSETFLGMLKFRYDGNLVFESWFEDSYSDPSSEWDIGGAGTTAANLHTYKSLGSKIICNRVKLRFDDYEALPALDGDTYRVIYKNTKNYDETTDQISIEVAAGEYWPGPGSQDVLVARYRDPESGEALIGTDVQTPTIGTSGDVDILCSGGSLTLVSFNGSTSDTHQEEGASQLILRNTTGSTITITRLRIRGTAYRIAAKVTTEAVDATISDNWDYVDKTISGKYAVGVSKAKQTCEWWMEYGKTARKEYEVAIDWTPQMQEGALVNLTEPGGSEVTCQVIEYSHEVPGRTMASARTVLKLREWMSFTSNDVGSSYTEDETDPSTGTGDNQTANTPSLTDIDDGYDNPDPDATNGGTTTPTTPTPEATGAYKAIVLTVDWQKNLTNFDGYEWQVTDDSEAVYDQDYVDWYKLGFDGTDWKTGATGAKYESEDTFFVHHSIPFGGTDDTPTTVTLYYRVRRFTKVGDYSGWSDTVSATTSLVQTRDFAAGSVSTSKLAANAVTAAKIATDALEAQFANVSHQLTIGYSGSGTPSSPAEGDVRIYLDGDEIRTEVYSNSAWSSERRVRVGGADASGNFLPFFQGRGLIGDYDDLPVIGDPVPADTSLRLFQFENNREDQNGVDPWTESFPSDVAYSATAWQGSYSLHPTDLISASYSSGWTVGSSCSAAFMFRVDDTDTTAHDLVEFSSSGSYNDAILLRFQSVSSAMCLRMTVEKGGTSTYLTSAELTRNTWLFVAMTYDADTNSASLWVDDTVVTDTPSGTWGSAVSRPVYLSMYSSGTTAVRYMDDLLISPTYALTSDQVLQHYESGLPWMADYRMQDVLLIPRSGGNVRLPNSSGDLQAVSLPDQDLNTDDNVEFAQLALSGQLTLSDAMLPTDDPTTYSTQTISANGSWTPSRGVYVIIPQDVYVRIQLYDGSTWKSSANDAGVQATVFCDGSTVRIKNHYILGSKDVGYMRF